MGVKLLITSESELEHQNWMSEEEAIEESFLTKKAVPFQ